MKKTLSMVMAIAMLLTSLVGFSSAVAEEKIKMNFSHLFVSTESFYDVIMPAVERFNAENPKYEIIIEEMPGDAYLAQTNARGAAVDLAEIVMVNGTMMKAFSDSGAIIPLTDVVEKMDFESKIKPGLLTVGTNLDDGIVYSLPIAAGTYGFILYNSEIFKEVGIDEFPKTLDELVAVGKKLSDAGYTPMGLGIKNLWPVDSLLFSAYVNNFVGTEWFNGICKHDGSSSFNDPQFIRALTEIQNLAKAGLFNPDFVSIDHNERMGMYLNRKVAMISAGDWECKGVVEADEALGDATMVATWPAPATDAAATNSITLSAAWGIAFGSKITPEQKEGAEIFVKDYFFTQDSGRILIEENNEFPSWIVDEYDAASLTKPAVRLQEQVATCTGCMNWDSSLDPTVKEVFQRGMQDLLIGNITPEDLASDMQDEYEMVNE